MLNCYAWSSFFKDLENGSIWLISPVRSFHWKPIWTLSGYWRSWMARIWYLHQHSRKWHSISYYLNKMDCVASYVLRIMTFVVYLELMTNFEWNIPQLIGYSSSDVTRWRSHLPAPGNVSLHKGSTHALLTRAFVQYLLYNKTAKDFARWLRKTNFPDESLVPSLNHSPQLQVPGAYTGMSIGMVSDTNMIHSYRYCSLINIKYPI